MDLFKPQLEGLSRRARRAFRKEAESQHPLLGGQYDPYVVNTTLWGDTRASDSNTGPSMALWKRCKRASFRDDPSLGYIFKPDLYNCPKFATTVSQMGLIALQDTGVTIQGDPAQSGVMQWAGQDADNDCGTLTAAGGVGTSFVISTTDPRELWYEIGLRKSNVTDNGMAFFAGLTEEAMNAATNTLLATDSADLADKDLIGFHVDQANGDSIDFVYNKASAGGVTVKIAGLSAMVAATWYKLGFHFNPLAPTANRITIYLNGQPQTTFVTGTNISASTFPAGEELVPTIAVKVGSGSLTDTFDVRLWEVAQRLAL